MHIILQQTYKKTGTMKLEINKRLCINDIEQKQQENIFIKQKAERSAQASNFFLIQSHTGHAFSLTSNHRDMCRMPVFKEAFF